MYNYWNYNESEYNESATYELVTYIHNEIGFNNNYQTAMFSPTEADISFYPTEISTIVKTHAKNMFRRVEE